jgi:hypothetical protein
VKHPTTTAALLAELDASITPEQRKALRVAHHAAGTSAIPLF